MTWYQLALLGVAAFAYWQAPDRPLLRTANILMVNMAVMTIAFYVTGTNANFVFNAIVDTVSAWLIMREPADKEQGWIGLSLAVQIGCHISAYHLHHIGKIGIPVIEPSYFSLLNYLFLIQISLLIAWGESSGGKLGHIADRTARVLFPRVARS